MQDSELLFNTISAITFGLAVSMAPSAARAASDDSHGLYIGAGVGQSDVDTNCAIAGAISNCDTTTTAWKGYLGYQFNGNAGTGGESNIQMWTVGLNYKF